MGRRREFGSGSNYPTQADGGLEWGTRLLVHVYFLIGFRNRLQVIWEWAWAYLRYQKGARLITGNSDSIAPEIHDEAGGGPRLEDRKVS
jgi:NADH dehydrogenase